MIEFKGSLKSFFKAYPKDKRSLDEVYCIVSYNAITKKETKTSYHFVGSLGEKCFKKIKDRSSDELELEKIKQTFSTIKAGDEEDIRRLQAIIKNANSWNDFINTRVIALLNRVNAYRFYVNNEETDWNFGDDSDEKIDEYIDIIDKRIGVDVLFNEDHRLCAMKLYDDEIILLARFRDEWMSGCRSIIKFCRTQSGFDFNMVNHINKLIKNLNSISEGYINVIDDIASDYKLFGDKFSDYKIPGIKTSVGNKLAKLNYYLSRLYISYHEKLEDFGD